MARATGSSRTTTETQFSDNRAGDPAPQDDTISGTRADYAPTGADARTTFFATLKRTVKEFSEDNLTDWAAALTYYGVLALFPALLAVLSIVGLVADPKTLTDAITAVIPGSAQHTIAPGVAHMTGRSGAAGFGLVLGIVGAIWSAS